MIDERLIEHVRGLLAKGRTKEEIKSMLVSAGLSEEEAIDYVKRAEAKPGEEITDKEKMEGYALKGEWIKAASPLKPGEKLGEKPGEGIKPEHNLAKEVISAEMKSVPNALSVFEKIYLVVASPSRLFNLIRFEKPLKSVSFIVMLYSFMLFVALLISVIQGIVYEGIPFETALMIFLAFIALIALFLFKALFNSVVLQLVCLISRKVDLKIDLKNSFRIASFSLFPWILAGLLTDFLFLGFAFSGSLELSGISSLSFDSLTAYGSAVFIVLSLVFVCLLAWEFFLLVVGCKTLHNLSLSKSLAASFLYELALFLVYLVFYFFVPFSGLLASVGF